MFRLLAFYRERPLDRQFVLSAGETKVLGRSSVADFCTDWDSLISRRHVRLEGTPTGLRIVCLDEASNPVFFDGREIRTAELSSGQSFVIGNTRFELRDVVLTDSPEDVRGELRAIDRNRLKKVRYSDADRRIEILASLPDVIRESGVERDLNVGLCTLLLSGISGADAVAVVRIDDAGNVDVLHQECRDDTAGTIRPSSRMIRSALDRQKTILHEWNDPAAGRTGHYTQDARFNWAFCTPFFTDIHRGRAFYVAGAGMSMGVPAETEQRLHPDIKFTEFIAEFAGSLQRQRVLERRQAGLRQFFSPPVLEAIGDDLDTSLLEPRECDVAVLFCDLRGFSRRAEETDDLLGLLDRVSLALEVMTRQILKFGGVTGDFQGDAALGFWGWPIESEEAPLNACRAALAIRQEFARANTDPRHPLYDFDTSIGVAWGRAVAGKIGTRDQVKVTVFGPVVNLASRLESMTRLLHVPVLIDERLDHLVRTRMDPDEGRVRRLVRLQPYGMDRPLLVSELVPPESELPMLTSEHLTEFERGVDAFLAGDWEAAWSFLHRMPPDDRAQDFLAMHITHHHRRPPDDWDGVIRGLSKGS